MNERSSSGEPKLTPRASLPLPGSVGWRREPPAAAWLRLVLGLLLGAAFPVLRSGAAAPPKPFFVATNGNDTWSGLLPAPNAARNDGPFATLTRAAAAVRSLGAPTASVPSQPVTVFLRGGLYRLSEPVVFTAADSGTSNRPVRYRAYQNETPVLSGGRRISGWTAAPVDGRPLWVASIPEVRTGAWYFRELWVNGSPRHRARHPKNGYLAVAEIPEAKGDTPWTQGQASFRFAPGDLRATRTITNAEVRVMNRWTESHLPVVAVDEANRVVRFGKRTVFKLDPGDLYYAENALEWLDAPGEWYLDRESGRLYYWPLAGEDLTRANVIAPVLSCLVRFDGRPEGGGGLEHLSFEGLTFSHTQWSFPSGFDSGTNRVEIWPPPAAEVGGFGQAAIGVPGAVVGEGLRHARFDRCRFIHLGTYGLELGRGCQYNEIARCEFADLGAGGIKLGETVLRDRPAEIAATNIVRDCSVHDGGRRFHSAIGIWIGQSPGNQLLHNLIHDFYYTGISVGWTWGYDRALATNTLVEFNHVHHIGKLSDGDGPILSDMAGIYTLGLQRGSIIRNNLWHDTAGLRYGGWGIYFDEGTTGLVAENNLVYRTTHGGFHQHYGRENVVRNNIFADARDFQIQRSRAEAHRSFTFEHNIVSWRQGKLLEGTFNDTNFLFQANLYWNANGGPVRFGSWTLPEWQARGQDLQSVIADPKFADPARDDFTLRPDSPAFGLGFRAFDLKSVGPEPSRVR